MIIACRCIPGKTDAHPGLISHETACQTSVQPEIGIGGSHHRLRPCHTTRHAGPHRAVREVEVMRAEVRRVDRSMQLSIRF